MNHQKKIYYIALLILYTNLIYGQEDKENAVSLKLHGMIKNDITYDTRQNINFRAGGMLLLPYDIRLDEDGRDLNETPQIHMLSIYSRAGVKVQLPSVFGAEIKGLLEGDFIGASELSMNNLRLRHAWILMDWGKTRLLIGQYWHPLFDPDFGPDCLGFAGGAPFIPGNRNPQIRVSQNIGKHIELQASFITQENTITSSNNSRLTDAPGASLKAIYNTHKGFKMGATAYYGYIQPSLVDLNLNVENTNSVHSFSVASYFRLETKPVTVTSQVTYAENGQALFLTGGIIGARERDKTEKFYSSRSSAFLLDVRSNHKKWKPGLLLSYTRNHGTKEFDHSQSCHFTAYGYMSNFGSLGTGSEKQKRSLDYAFRIAARLEYKIKKLTIGIEPEITSAVYGTANQYGKVVGDRNQVYNKRLLFTTMFTF